MPLKVTRSYVVADEIEELIRATTSLNREDSKALAEYVNRWGMPQSEKRRKGALQPLPVSWVRHDVWEIQWLAKWLHAMEGGEWESADLPPFEQAVGVLSQDYKTPAPSAIRRQERRAYYRAAFAHYLNRCLGERGEFPGIHPVLRNDVTGERLYLPGFNAMEPRQALLIFLWEWASGWRQLSRCKRCRAFFVVTRRDKQYCEGRCTRAAAMKRSRDKERMRRRTRRQQRAKSGGASVERRGGVDRVAQIGKATGG
jgi:hypothetical protein